jgi:hypothetical protein
MAQVGLWEFDSEGELKGGEEGEGGVKSKE